MVQNVMSYKPSLYQENSGFTIIELMVAMFIFAISLLGMLSGAINIKRINMENNLRNEAVKITQETLEQFRSTDKKALNAIDLIPDIKNICNSNIDNIIIRNIRGSHIKFGRFTTRSALPNTLEVDNVTLFVCWRYRNKNYQYNNSTLIK